MSTDEQTPVTTRVPAYQKEAWRADAEELGMSQSEFVRTMVQAGRRELGLADDSHGTDDPDTGDDTDTGDEFNETDERDTAVADGTSGEESHTVDSGAETTDPGSSAPVDDVSAVEPGTGDATPGVGGLEDRVLGVLSERGVCSWDDLLDAVMGDFEERLDETMSSLIESGPVTYSGREGGYVLDE
ncbi:DUF5805 domain-containing protein [Halobaculum sp. MBLA0147]|uniref:DUF5805 domain-containing protein n=1 Tax=Halobaculum sp. MBLA0147 TaxID=3079934 RepID=UPI00352557F5